MLPGQLLDNGSVVLGDYTLTSDQYRDWMMPALYPVNSSNVILLILYCLVFILAAVSNMLVIIVIYRFQHLRSVTNYFLVNLSVADLLVTVICMPMAMSQRITLIWFYGVFMCKFATYLQGVAASSSVFSILAMSMDRYFAIRHPIVFRQFFNKRVARCVILAIWVVAGLLFVPVLIVHHEEPLKLRGETHGNEVLVCQICKETWNDAWSKKAYSICLFVAIYALPVLLVLTAYVRMGSKLCTPSVLTNNRDGGDIILNRDSRLLHCRRRVARTLLILALVFAVCWMPYNLIQVVFDHLDENQVTQSNDTQTDDTSENLMMLRPFCLWLGHANSAVNPLLYCLFSRNIRQSLWNLFHPNGRNLHSSEPLPMSRRRCPVDKKRLQVQTGCSSLNNHQPGQHHQFHNGQRHDQVEELTGCERDSIVVDRLSPLTPPSFKNLMGPHLNSFTTALIPVKIGSLNKLVHLNKPATPGASSIGVNEEVADLDPTPTSYHSL